MRDGLMSFAYHFARPHEPPSAHPYVGDQVCGSAEKKQPARQDGDHARSGQIYNKDDDDVDHDDVPENVGSW